MTYTVPRLRTILHFGHIFFTDALTFIDLPPTDTFRLLPTAVNNEQQLDNHQSVRISASPSVMAMVRSKCAVRFPFADTTVQ